MQISMAGRIALITGGSKGLGYAMGMKFAECGAEVALVSRNKEEVARAAKEISTISSQRCLGYVGDVSNAADIETISSRSPMILAESMCLLTMLALLRRGSLPQSLMSNGNTILI